MPFFHNLAHFIGTIKFRYSIVMILIFANLFIMIFPCILTSISKDHWDLIKDIAKTFLMLLAMSIGFYFNHKTGQTDSSNENLEPKTP